MPPSPAPRDKRPSRIAALLRRKWSWKDIALMVLALSFVSMSAYAFRAPISSAFARFRADAQGRETVSVFDVVVDRENRQYFDILFDKPLGQGKVGEVLDPAPASIFRTWGGVPRRDAVSTIRSTRRCWRLSVPRARSSPEQGPRLRSLDSGPAPEKGGSSLQPTVQTRLYPKQAARSVSYLGPPGGEPEDFEEERFIASVGRPVPPRAAAT